MVGYNSFPFPIQAGSLVANSGYKCILLLKGRRIADARLVR